MLLVLKTSLTYKRDYLIIFINELITLLKVIIRLFNSFIISLLFEANIYYKVFN
jgi:hypothetical protein